jgi:hypothetical protein
MIVYPPSRASVWWVHGFLLFQFACQSALVIEGLGPLRTALRVAVFASSILLVVLVPTGGRPYPLRSVTAAVVALTAFGLIHPSLNTPLSGFGQLALTLAVWGPVFWVTRTRLTADGFRQVLIAFWLFQTASAAFGVLQVYMPERFAPDPAYVRQILGTSIDGLLVTLDDGRRVFRPMGLSDTPGGAAAAGMFAVLTGFAVATSSRSLVVRTATIPAAVIGLFCIYLCQVRSTLILTAISLIGLIGLLTVRGRLGRAAGLVAATVFVGAGGFAWAGTVGSEAVKARLETLTKESAGTVYYQNRGIFLEETVETLIPKFPVGAGLGRWGMMHAYFGTPSNPDSPVLHAEIQVTAWVYDGGLLMLVLGYLGVGGALVLSVKAATDARSPELADAAGVVVALNVGVLVGTFGYIPFAGQMGMMFWLLNVALFTATVADAKERA